MNLTQNVIKAFNEDNLSTPFTVQVLSLKKVRGESTVDSPNDVFTVNLSDGVHHATAILHASLNNYIFSKKLTKHSVITIVSFRKTNKGAMLIENIESEIAQSPKIIGNPTSFRRSASSQNTSKTHVAEKQPSQSFARAPQYSAGAPESSEYLSILESSVQPIKTLNPFLDKFTVKGTITRLAPARTWQKGQKKGKVFSFDILDGYGGEISVSAFNEDVDKFLPMVQKGSTLIIHNGSIKGVNRSFTSTNNNYGITLNERSVVIEAKNKINVTFQMDPVDSIDSLMFLENESNFDILLVVLGEPNNTKITTKKGDNLSRTTVLCGDASMKAVNVIFWGALGEQVLSLRPGIIIGLKQTKINIYGDDRSLSVGFKTGVFMSAGQCEGGSSIVSELFEKGLAEDLGKGSHKLMEKVAALEDWYAKYKKSEGRVGVQSISRTREGGAAKLKRIEEIHRFMLGQGEKPEFFNLIVVIERVFATTERPPFYNSCMNADCRKKVTMDGNGFMFCAKCQISVPDSKPRYAFGAKVADFSGTQVVTFFENPGSTIFNCEAEDIKTIIGRGDTNGFRDVINRPRFKFFNIRCKAQSDEYNDDTITKVSAMNVNLVNWKRDGHLIADRLEQLLTE